MHSAALDPGELDIFIQLKNLSSVVHDKLTEPDVIIIIPWSRTSRWFIRRLCMVFLMGENRSSLISSTTARKEPCKDLLEAT